MLVFKNLSDLSKHDANSIQGLVIFNQESNSAKMQGKASNKIVLQHISAIQKADVEILFDQALEFLWKYSHCHAIRLNLSHVKYPDGSIKADPEIKAILKLKKFKWKTVVNDVNGRSEILEVLNTAF